MRKLLSLSVVLAAGVAAILSRGFAQDISPNIFSTSNIVT
jgi:hypothetical protein